MFGRRYGAAELFGRAVISLGAEEMRRLAAISHRDVVCPFKPGGGVCHKKGGVCSLAVYEAADEDKVRLVETPVTTCPTRFLEGGRIFSWVGDLVLGSTTPMVVGELPFLMADQGNDPASGDEVGRIDNVLVVEQEGQMAWCAVEMQAVYFSGDSFESDFKVLREWTREGPPFPAGRRRPDFRSSGPKRLMPQLQIKVPTLRRWGKKMVVVVDIHFWEALGEMRQAGSLSNADIVWAIVDYTGPDEGVYQLRPAKAVFTTLENAVEGLTGGTPVSLEEFERAIRRKLERAAAS
jgi:hypothetical protein